MSCPKCGGSTPYCLDPAHDKPDQKEGLVEHVRLLVIARRQGQPIPPGSFLATLLDAFEAGERGFGR